MVAPGVSAPAASYVTGNIVTDYVGTFPMPTFPSLASINRGYLLLTVPATLPRSGDSPASDGRYYYFPLLASLKSTTITAGRNVTVVCANVRSNITIQAGASLIVYTWGTIESEKIDNQAWAGALQIFTSTRNDCELDLGRTLRLCSGPGHMAWALSIAVSLHHWHVALPTRQRRLARASHKLLVRMPF